MGNKFLHFAKSTENVREKVQDGGQNLWNFRGIATIERVISERDAVLKADLPLWPVSKLRFSERFSRNRAKKEAGCWRRIGDPNESIYRNSVCEGPKLPLVKYPSVVSYGNTFTRDHELDQIPPR